MNRRQNEAQRLLRDCSTGPAVKHRPRDWRLNFCGLKVSKPLIQVIRLEGPMA
jgi:hypothetical protein